MTAQLETTLAQRFADALAEKRSPRRGPSNRRRYRRYKARTKQLPASYHSAIVALERYLEIFGPGQTDSLLSMLEDLADLFERSVATGTPVRAVVGENPVEFADAFLRNYPGSPWISRERERLADAIDRVAEHEP